MIDRGDIRQAIDRRLQQYLGFTAGRWLWSVRRKYDKAPDYHSKKRAERSERLMYDRVTALSPLWLSASSSACRAVNRCRR